jgi:hypothetical protein
MSSSRHLETDRLTERVNNTFQQLLRGLCCYDGSDWTTLLHEVEFAYNASRALGIEHTPFEAYFGFSHEEPPDLLLKHATVNSGFARCNRAVKIVTGSTYHGTLYVTAT